MRTTHLQFIIINSRFINTETWGKVDLWMGNAGLDPVPYVFDGTYYDAENKSGHGLKRDHYHKLPAVM